MWTWPFLRPGFVSISSKPSFFVLSENNIYNFERWFLEFQSANHREPSDDANHRKSQKARASEAQTANHRLHGCIKQPTNRTRKRTGPPCWTVGNPWIIPKLTRATSMVPAGWWLKNHLEKYESSSMGRMTSHIWNGKWNSCSKPPNSQQTWCIDPRRVGHSARKIGILQPMYHGSSQGPPPTAPKVTPWWCWWWITLKNVWPWLLGVPLGRASLNLKIELGFHWTNVRIRQNIQILVSTCEDPLRPETDTWISAEICDICSKFPSPRSGNTRSAPAETPGVPLGGDIGLQRRWQVESQQFWCWHQHFVSMDWFKGKFTGKPHI